MVKSGDVLEAPSLGVRDRVPPDRGRDRRRVDASSTWSGARAASSRNRTSTAADGAPRGHRGLDGVHQGRAHADPRPGRVGGDAARHAAPARRRRARAGPRPGPERPSGRVEEFLEDLARMDRDGEMTRAGSRSRSPARASSSTTSTTPTRAFPPPRVQRAARDAASCASRTSPRTSTSSSTSGTSRRRSRPSTPRSATPARTPTGGGRRTSTSARRASPASATSPTTTSAARSPTRSRPPRAPRATSRRTSSRPTSTATCAAPGSGRSRRRPAGTHVRFDWRVAADRAFLRVLTPVLRPLFRWNHGWAIKRAQEGLEPYARRGARRSAAGDAADVAAP